MSAMPRAWSWSMAMTRPPASGSTARIVGQPLVGAAQHRRQPLAVERQGGAQALRRAGGVEGVVEAGGDLLAVGRDPLHVAADPREVHRAHDPAVAQGVAVAVRVVGPGLVEHVVDERDRRRCPTGTACRTGPGGGAAPREGDPDRVAPGPLVGGVVDLVEDDEGAVGAARAAPAAAEATCWYVVTTPWRSPASAVGGRPRRVEVEPDAVGGGRPTAPSGGRSGPRRPGATGRRPSSWRAAARANVVLPAPGVATARKSGASASTNASKAAFCQGRRRIVLVIGGTTSLAAIGPATAF